MIKIKPPVDWTIFVSYEGADKLESIIKSKPSIQFHSFENVLNGEYGLDFELSSRNGSSVPVTRDMVEAIAKEYLEIQE